MLQEPGRAELAEKPYPRIVPGFSLVEVAIAPVCNEAAIFESQGFAWVHVVDLNGAFEGEPVNADAVSSILANVSAWSVTMGPANPP